MNLKYMIELQGGLMKHIQKEHDLPFIPFGDTILALLVEIGECANESRCFKYWSKDRKPRTLKKKGEPKPTKYVTGSMQEWYNPLLEEYIDGFHLVLQSGILLKEEGLIYMGSVYEDVYTYASLSEQFKRIYTAITDLNIAYVSQRNIERKFNHLMELYLGLGKLLGFTEQEILAAYIEKNKINHERQRDGY
jgi:dimeric dUTPase (all-alpha-NTP-PPase superfamily)